MLQPQLIITSRKIISIKKNTKSIHNDYEEFVFTLDNGDVIFASTGYICGIKCKYESYFTFNVRHNRLDHHRVDGPAYVNSIGDKTYLFNGKFHRVDGPARIVKNCRTYYLRGREYTKERWFAKLSPRQREKAIWNTNEI